MAFLAFKNCDVEKIESLLDDNECDVASICATDPRYNGYCMLHFACGYCTLEIIEMVLKHPTCKINVLNKPAAGREQMTALDFILHNILQAHAQATRSSSDVKRLQQKIVIPQSLV